MKSNRPYFIRAINEWLLDHNLTPHLLIASDQPHVQVPQQFAQDGRIILNVAPGAVNNLVMSNDFVEFTARFSGTPMSISVPVSAVLAIYAKENGQGMSFGEPELPPENDGPDGDDQEPPKAKPSLKVVK